MGQQKFAKPPTKKQQKALEAITDRYLVSYAPSATLYAWLQEQPRTKAQAPGSLLALATAAALLATVITCGVTVSSIANNTLLGIAVLWMLLYGAGYENKDTAPRALAEWVAGLPDWPGKPEQISPDQILDAELLTENTNAP